MFLINIEQIYLLSHQKQRKNVKTTRQVVEQSRDNWLQKTYVINIHLIQSSKNVVIYIYWLWTVCVCQRKRLCSIGDIKEPNENAIYESISLLSPGDKPIWLEKCRKWIEIKNKAMMKSKERQRVSWQREKSHSRFFYCSCSIKTKTAKSIPTQFLWWWRYVIIFFLYTYSFFVYSLCNECNLQCSSVAHTHSTRAQSNNINVLRQNIIKFLVDIENLVIQASLFFAGLFFVHSHLFSSHSCTTQ